MTIDEIINLDKKCFDSNWTEDFYIKLLNSDKNHIFYIEKEEKKIGFAIVMDTTELCELIKIGVIPEYRNLGYGFELIEMAIKRTKELERDKIILELRAGNEKAFNLYLRKEFKVISKRKNYYKDTGEDAIIMLKRL